MASVAEVAAHEVEQDRQGNDEFDHAKKRPSLATGHVLLWLGPVRFHAGRIPLVSISERFSD